MCLLLRHFSSASFTSQQLFFFGVCVCACHTFHVYCKRCISLFLAPSSTTLPLRTLQLSIRSSFFIVLFCFFLIRA